MFSSSFSTCGQCGGVDNDTGRKPNGAYVGRCTCGQYKPEPAFRSFPKTGRYRNAAILDHARNIEECTFCRVHPAPGSIVAAHSNQGIHGKAGGRKADDCFIAYLCPTCHGAVDHDREWEQVALYIWNAAHQRSIPMFQHLLDDEGRRLLGVQ